MSFPKQNTSESANRPILGAKQRQAVQKTKPLQRLDSVLITLKALDFHANCAACTGERVYCGAAGTPLFPASEATVAGGGCGGGCETSRACVW